MSISDTIDDLIKDLLPQDNEAEAPLEELQTNPQEFKIVHLVPKEKPPEEKPAEKPAKKAAPVKAKAEKKPAKKATPATPKSAEKLRAEREAEKAAAEQEAQEEKPPEVLPGIWKRIDTKALYPPFFRKLEQLVVNCEARGARYYATSGYRSPEEQNKLYAQGRRTPGQIVTNARAWQSNHQFRCAVDFCRDSRPDRAGLQPDWELESYRILAEEAKKLGLEAAFYWKTFREGPHIQLPLASRGLTTQRLKEAALSGGTKALFALLDKYQW